MVGINLIPEPVQLAQLRRWRLKWWATAILVSLMVLALPLGLDWLKQAEAARLHLEDEHLRVQLAGIRSQLRSVSAGADEAFLQLERADALRSKRCWSGMLAMIGRRMPSGCWLTSITTDPATPQGAAPPQRRAKSRPSTPEEPPAVVVIDAPRKLNISGYATTAGEPHTFVTRLKDMGIFTNVELQRVAREPVLDDSYFRFELYCEW